MEIMRQVSYFGGWWRPEHFEVGENVLELDAYDVTTLDRIEELELTIFVGYDLILLDAWWAC